MDMQVVVVDDSAQFAGEVMGAAEDFFRGEGVRAKIRYQKAAELLEETEKGLCCDLCLLDVEMPEIDGLTLAERIRERDEDVRIVFLTAHEKYAISGYRVRADGYILKGNYREELPPMLRRIYGELQKKEEAYYVIRSENQGCRIRTDDILYLKKDKKYTVFQCTGGREYRQRETLENVFRKLSQDRFIFIDKSIVVNMGHVVSYAWMALAMRDGTRLQASRRMWPSVRDRLYDYWVKR